MTGAHFKRMRIGFQVGYVPTGEIAELIERLEEGFRVRWRDGSIGTLVWSDAKHLAHAGRAPRPDVSERAKGGA